jgi:hypothetical protein
MVSFFFGMRAEAPGPRQKPANQELPKAIL